MDHRLEVIAREYAGKRRTPEKKNLTADYTDFVDVMNRRKRSLARFVEKKLGKSSR
jgi:hypothetical protein